MMYKGALLSGSRLEKNSSLSALAAAQLFAATAASFSIGAPTKFPHSVHDPS